MDGLYFYGGEKGYALKGKLYPFPFYHSTYSLLKNLVNKNDKFGSRPIQKSDILVLPKFLAVWSDKDEDCPF